MQERVILRQRDWLIMAELYRSHKSMVAITYRHLCLVINVRSESSVHRRLSRLTEMGLTKMPGSRGGSVRLTEKGVEAMEMRLAAKEDSVE